MPGPQGVKTPLSFCQATLNKLCDILEGDYLFAQACIKLGERGVSWLLNARSHGFTMFSARGAGRFAW